MPTTPKTQRQSPPKAIAPVAAPAPAPASEAATGPDGQPLPPVPPPLAASSPARRPTPVGGQAGVQTIGPVSRPGRPSLGIPVPPHMSTMVGGVVIDPETGRPPGLSVAQAAQWDAERLADLTGSVLSALGGLQHRIGLYVEGTQSPDTAKLYEAAAVLAELDLNRLADLYLDIESLLIKHGDRNAPTPEEVPHA